MTLEDALPIMPHPRECFEGVLLGPIDRGVGWWSDVDAFIDSISLPAFTKEPPKRKRFPLPGSRGYNG